MAKGTTIQLIGDKQILNMLKKLPTKAKDKKFWRATARGAAFPVVKEVRNLIEQDSFEDTEDHLLRAIKYRNFSNNVLAGLGGYVKFDHKAPNRDNKHLHKAALAAVLVFNRKVRPLKKTFRNWIKQAAKNEEDQSTKFMAKRAASFMQREIKKLL